MATEHPSNTVAAPSASSQRALLLARAFAFGFRVETCDDQAEPLFGRFWWSLSRPGIDIEVSKDEWATADEAIDAIIVAHDERLMATEADKEMLGPDAEAFGLRDVGDK